MSKKTKKKSVQATLTSVTEEMARPRFAESTRKEEEANRRTTKQDKRRLQMKNKKLIMLSCYAFAVSIVVLTIGFLGIGVRAFATAGTTGIIFLSTFAIIVMVLVLYFTARRLLDNWRKRPRSFPLDISNPGHNRLKRHFRWSRESSKIAQ